MLNLNLNLKTSNSKPYPLKNPLPISSFVIRHSSFALALFAATTAPLLAQPTLGDPEERIIHYNSCEGLSDPIAQLQRRLADGTVRLNFEPGKGYLSSLLKELGVPVSSQALVFSKTSSQKEQTTPQSPRAIYFGDDISVGWVPDGSVIDLASVDPNRGPIFYTLNQSSDSPPKFTRRNDC